MPSITARLATAAAAAVTAAAALAPSAAAQGPSGQERLDASVSAPTRDGARAVGITVVRTARPSDGSRPRNATRFLFGIPRGFVINGRAFPTCTVATAERDPASCAPARIGSGTVTIDARPALPEPVEGRIEIFNGPPADGAPATQITRIVTPLVTRVIAAYVRRPTGADRRRFSYIWDERVPAEATMAGGPVTTRFEIRIDRRTTVRAGRRVALIQAPRRCRPRATWTFRLVTQLADAPTETVTDRLRCRA